MAFSSVPIVAAINDKKHHHEKHISSRIYPDCTMNPTLRHMRAFVALARTGNFTLAAQYLHVSQCALSGLVEELGQTLSMRVVDRGPRTIPARSGR
jgi:hypothetical protein